MGLRTYFWACDLNIYWEERVDVKAEPNFGLKEKPSPPRGFCSSFYHFLLVRRWYSYVITI